MIPDSVPGNDYEECLFKFYSRMSLKQHGLVVRVMVGHIYQVSFLSLRIVGGLLAMVVFCLPIDIHFVLIVFYD
jgi:hypothetical protein